MSKKADYSRAWYKKNKEKAKSWSKRYKLNNPERVNLYKRTYRLKKEYKLTLVGWELLFKHQKGKCAICTIKIYRYKNKLGRLAADVDHDHKTGKVRGLLCHDCNLHRVGKNTLETSIKVVEYLKYHARELDDAIHD